MIYGSESVRPLTDLDAADDPRNGVARQSAETVDGSHATWQGTTDDACGSDGAQARVGGANASVAAGDSRMVDTPVTGCVSEAEQRLQGLCLASLTPSQE